MNRFGIEAAAITYVGASGNNEDNYYVNGTYKSDTNIGTDGISDKKPRPSYTYAVCDGMGGEGHGELASLIAAATLVKYKETNIRQTVGSYINTVNEFICDLIRKDSTVKSGTTLALLDLRNNTAVSYNIGNSRVYLCRKGKLYLLSEDSTAQEQTKDTPAQYLGILPSETGTAAHMSGEIKLKKGDIFMLCTDGLTCAVSDKDIVEILSAEKATATVASMAKKLVASSQEKAKKDDVTVIVIKLS